MKYWRLHTSSTQSTGEDVLLFILNSVEKDLLYGFHMEEVEREREREHRQKKEKNTVSVPA